MANYIHLLKAECLKVFGDVKNYWLNYIFGNINVFFMFLGLFYAFSQENQTEMKSLLFLIGLMYWYFGVHAVDLVSVLIEEEIEQGTLEQLLMSRTPLALSLFFRIIAQILFDAFKGIFVFVLCMIFFRIDITLLFSIRFGLACVVFFIGLLALYGIGYMIAGLSLVYKRATSIASISSNIILLFSGATISVTLFPTGIQMLMKLFPIYWSNQVIEKIMLGNYKHLPLVFLVLLIELILWNGAGLICLNQCLKRVYEKGTTGSY